MMMGAAFSDRDETNREREKLYPSLCAVVFKFEIKP